ncbi:MAG: LemA family protein [Limnohabitans sp.]|jgi:LemA protein|nr:LemA family protein [Limnohabitans sp.]
MTDSWLFWGVVAISLFWAVGVYRRLMALRAQVVRQFAVLEEMLMRYQALVQDATTAAVTSPSNWQTAIAPELGASHWTRLQVAANLSAMAIAHMQEHPLDPNSVIALAATNRDLHAAWDSLTHPDVYYVAVPEELTQRWRELGIAIGPDIQRFNQAVEAYNDAIALFPASLMARVLKFKPGRPLE